MPYCPNCGKEVEAGIRFCPDCGTQLGAAGRASAKSQPLLQAEPKGIIVNITSLLALLTGIVYLALGVLSLFLSTASFRVFVVTLLAFLSVGSLSLISLYGLRKGKHWMRIEGIISAAVALGIGLLFVASGNGLSIGIGSLAAVFGAMLLYFTRSKAGTGYLAN